MPSDIQSAVRWSDPEPEVYATGVASALGWHFEAGSLVPVADALVEEAPIALVFAGQAPIVMMATPVDVEDFACGFAISEGIVDCRSQILSIESAPANGGMVVFVELADGLESRVEARRRAGVVAGGCGLCGVGQIEQALRLAPKLGNGSRFGAAAIGRAFAALPPLQRIGQRTGGAHGAAFADAGGDILAFAEDAGRHNALDKLIGKVANLGHDPADGFCAVTSRASFEMAQKAVAAGFPMLCAISAPTGLAVRLAQTSNLTLCAFARGQQFTCYSAPHRLAL